MLRYNCYHRTYEFVQPSSGEKTVTVLLPRLNVTPGSGGGPGSSTVSSGTSLGRWWPDAEPTSSPTSTTKSSRSPLASEKRRSIAATPTRASKVEAEPDYDDDEDTYDVDVEFGDELDDEDDDKLLNLNHSSRSDWVDGRNESSLDGVPATDADYEFEGSPTPNSTPTPRADAAGLERDDCNNKPVGRNSSEGSGIRHKTTVVIGPSDGEWSMMSTPTSTVDKHVSRHNKHGHRHHHHHHHHRHTVDIDDGYAFAKRDNETNDRKKTISKTRQSQ